jgi:hypothetical protein
MWEKGEEPPMVGLYRKETIGELDALRLEDMPEVREGGAAARGWVISAVHA